MKSVRIAIPGEANYQQPGYFVVDSIITFRCENCFQHMSLLKYDVLKDGTVTPDIVCLNCKFVHEGVVLSLFDSKVKKVKDEIYTKLEAVSIDEKVI